MFEMAQCQKLKTSKKNLYLETFKNTKFVHIHAYITSDTYNTTFPCISPHNVIVFLYFVPGIPVVSFLPLWFPPVVFTPLFPGTSPRCDLSCSPLWPVVVSPLCGRPTRRCPSPCCVPVWVPVSHGVHQLSFVVPSSWGGPTACSVSSVAVLFVVSLWSQCFISWPLIVVWLFVCMLLFVLFCVFFMFMLTVSSL